MVRIVRRSLVACHSDPKREASCDREAAEQGHVAGTRESWTEKALKHAAVRHVIIFLLVVVRGGENKAESRTGRAADRPRNTDCLRRVEVVSEVVGSYYSP